jgi:hypothetical protein
MATFKANQPVETTDPTVNVDLTEATGLPAGKYRFQLVVTDSDGIASDPVVAEVTVRDLRKPTAKLTVPTSPVDFGQSIKLDGTGSTSPRAGRTLKYRWTLLG